jgi:hypothetical protein
MKISSTRKLLVLIFCAFHMNFAIAEVHFNDSIKHSMRIGKTTRSHLLKENKCVTYSGGGYGCECREEGKSLNDCGIFWLKGNLLLFDKGGVLEEIEAEIDLGNGVAVSEIMELLRESGYLDISIEKVSYNESGFDGGPDEIYFGNAHLGVVWCHMEYHFKDDSHSYLLSVNGVFGDMTYTKEMTEAGIPSRDVLISYKKLDQKLLNVFESECKNHIVNGKIVVENKK